MGPHLVHNHYIKDPWDLPCSLANITWGTPIFGIADTLCDPSPPCVARFIWQNVSALPDKFQGLKEWCIDVHV